MLTISLARCNGAMRRPYHAPRDIVQKLPVLELKTRRDLTWFNQVDPFVSTSEDLIQNPHWVLLSENQRRSLKRRAMQQALQQPEHADPAPPPDPPKAEANPPAVGGIYTLFRRNEFGTTMAEELKRNPHWIGFTEKQRQVLRQKAKQEELRSKLVQRKELAAKEEQERLKKEEAVKQESATEEISPESGCRQREVSEDAGLLLGEPHPQGTPSSLGPDETPANLESTAEETLQIQEVCEQHTQTEVVHSLKSLAEEAVKNAECQQKVHKEANVESDTVQDTNADEPQRSTYTQETMTLWQSDLAKSSPSSTAPEISQKEQQEAVPEPAAEDSLPQRVSSDIVYNDHTTYVSHSDESKPHHDDLQKENRCSSELQVSGTLTESLSDLPHDEVKKGKAPSEEPQTEQLTENLHEADLHNDLQKGKARSEEFHPTEPPTTESLTKLPHNELQKKEACSEIALETTYGTVPKEEGTKYIGDGMIQNEAAMMGKQTEERHKERGHLAVPVTNMKTAQTQTQLTPAWVHRKADLKATAKYYHVPLKEAPSWARMAGARPKMPCQENLVKGKQHTKENQQKVNRPTMKCSCGDKCRLCSNGPPVGVGPRIVYSKQIPSKDALIPVSLPKPQKPKLPMSKETLLNLTSIERYNAIQNVKRYIFLREIVPNLKWFSL